MKHLPHLTYLRSFEAAARLRSFTAAAEDLNLTQSAVSNHVRSLEEFIGRPLFVRLPRSLALTEIGEAYLPTVRQALHQIDAATESVLAPRRKRELVLSCPTSLATNWLPDVIAQFRAQHPGIRLTVHGTVWTDPEPEVADIAIAVAHRDELPPGSIRLWPEKLAVICAPDFRVDDRPLTDPAQLPHAALIRVLGRHENWECVARHFGVALGPASDSFQTDVSSLAIELAARGSGCAAVPRSLIAHHVAAGLVVEPFPLDLDCPWTYCARFPEGAPGSPIRLFREWLLAAAAIQRG